MALTLHVTGGDAVCGWWQSGKASQRRWQSSWIVHGVQDYDRPKGVRWGCPQWNQPRRLLNNTPALALAKYMGIPQNKLAGFECMGVGSPNE